MNKTFEGHTFIEDGGYNQLGGFIEFFQANQSLTDARDKYDKLV